MEETPSNPSIYKIGLSVSAHRLAPQKLDIMLSVNTEIALGDLITILQFLDGPLVDMALRVGQGPDSLVVQAAIHSNEVGHLDWLQSALSKLNLRNTLQVM